MNGMVFAIGLILGFLLAASVVTRDTVYNVYIEATAQIEHCEANLPRNQHCTLTAVPENK